MAYFPPFRNCPQIRPIYFYTQSAFAVNLTFDMKILQLNV